MSKLGGAITEAVNNLAEGFRHIGVTIGPATVPAEISSWDGASYLVADWRGQMIAIGGAEMEAAMPAIQVAMEEIRQPAEFRPWAGAASIHVTLSLAAMGVKPSLIPRLLRLPPAPTVSSAMSWPEEFVMFSHRSGLSLESLLDQVEARHG